ncbi:Exosome complex component MTR3 [Lamellibrachia satsuma]|nr:Exosome complex component MTR3 [Lamellibrachia satsuma]
MPVDTKRLPVPESSQSPYAFIDEQHAQQLGEERRDGRQTNELRPIFLKTGVVNEAKGSAYIELRHTKVICSVYGPREVTRREDFSMKGQLMCELKFATFSCQKRRGHQADKRDSEYSLLLQNALEPAILLDKFPKARMDVFVIVLQDDGSALAAAISCAAVALASAGVEMYDLVAGCSLTLSGDLKLLDPSTEEEYTPEKQKDESNANYGAVTVGLMPSLNQISALSQEGEMTLDTAYEAIRVCTTGCEQVYPVLQKCLEKSVKARLQKRSDMG